jgi:NAD(P)H-flavin reductase
MHKLSSEHDWLEVVPVVERDDDERGGVERGTLADAVTRHGAWAGHDVLVCGSPSMIRATVSRMVVAGTPLDRIRYDPFTMD